MVSLVQFRMPATAGDGCVAWEPSTAFFVTHWRFACCVFKIPERRAPGGVDVIAYLLGNRIETCISRNFCLGRVRLVST